ncbi:MAG: ABC transporter ATP-binding protein [Planctomycetia bacterium]|nr:ABC transporter ATP-binding protein [Planctomycetia bacterium]
MSRPIVEFHAVNKTFHTGLVWRKRIEALKNVTLSIPRGSVFGVIGPNLAGKTTLVKALLSLCQPTSGRIVRLERPADDRSTLARVGYVHEAQSFPQYLTAESLLYYYGGLSFTPAHDLKRRVPMLLDQVNLADRAHEPISTYSKGMVQRLALAQALVCDPELLVLSRPAPPRRQDRAAGLAQSVRRLEAVRPCGRAPRGGTEVRRHAGPIGRPPCRRRPPT